MKNYKKLIVGSLMTAIMIASPAMSFADNDKDKGREKNKGEERKEQKEDREEKNNKFSNWFSSGWFNGKGPKVTISVPVISDLIVSSNKGNKATLKWNTSVRSNSFVWYSTTSPVDTTVNPNMKRNDRVLKHKFELKRLQPNTKYYVVVGGANNKGIAKSAEMSFTTSASTTNSSVPVITSVVGQPTIKIGEEANFTINAYDPQNKVLTYGTDWGDGNTTSQLAFTGSVTVGHVYNAIGTYVAKFTITNSDGKKVTYPMQVKVVSLSADTTAPIVSAFVIPSTSTTLAVNVTTFTATDATGVTGYKLTETATAPLVGDAGWSATAPTVYTFGTAGSKTLYAWAKDAAGNVSASLSDGVTITLADTTAPVISAITTTVTGSSATISWTTNEEATSSVFYSIGTPVDVNSIITPKVVDGSLVTSHSLSVPSLVSSTLYHFIIKSADASNNVVLSSEATFTTN